MTSLDNTVAVAITGASGAVYATALLARLLQAGKSVALVVSNPAIAVIRHELGCDFSCQEGVLGALGELSLSAGAGAGKEVSSDQLTLYCVDDWFTPLASGSTAPRQMVICPCSMATLGAIANGAGQNLIHRAADVMLKENKRLLLMPRETPYSLIHLTNMTTLAKAGAMILPLSPSFYQRPQTIDDLVQTVIDRALHHLDVPVVERTPWYFT